MIHPIKIKNIQIPVIISEKSARNQAHPTCPRRHMYNIRLPHRNAHSKPNMMFQALTPIVVLANKENKIDITTKIT